MPTSSSIPQVNLCPRSILDVRLSAAWVPDVDSWGKGARCSEWRGAGEVERWQPISPEYLPRQERGTRRRHLRRQRRVIEAPYRISQASGDIVRLQVGIGFEDLFLALA